MAFDSLDKLLTAILSQPQWQKQKRFLELKKCWLEIANHKLAQHTRPISINHEEVLFIATSSAVWAQDLSLRRIQLKRQINALVEIPIKDLHFASVKWYNNYLSSDRQQDKQGKHPSLVDLNLPIPERANTAQESLEQWFEQIKQRSHNWQTCPECQTLCPEGELKRWGVCAICFRHLDES